MKVFLNGHMLVKFILWSSFMQIATSSCGQTKTFDSAENYFENALFVQAQPLFEQALKQRKNKAYKGIIHFKIAECVRFLSDSFAIAEYQNAIDACKLIGRHHLSENDARENLKSIALSYYYLGDLDNAFLWVNKYLKATANDDAIDKKMDQIFEELKSLPKYQHLN